MSKTILLIDANEIDNFINRKVLENCGASNILTFTSPAKALTHLSKTDDIPKMIFIDMYFPKTSCFEFLSKFKKLRISDQLISIFVLSVSVNPADKKKVRQRFSGFIEKPLTPEKLFNRFL